jgi:hypothetical protein
MTDNGGVILPPDLEKKEIYPTPFDFDSHAMRRLGDCKPTPIPSTNPSWSAEVNSVSKFKTPSDKGNSLRGWWQDQWTFLIADPVMRRSKKIGKE